MGSYANQFLSPISYFKELKKVITMSYNNFPPALVTIKNRIFDPLGFVIRNLVTAPESSAYDGCSFEINGVGVVFRSAKITPTKTGQFVTVWKRNEQGITQPYKGSDNFDCMVIHVASGLHSGQLILPKTALLTYGIIEGTKSGKRGFRVYPPWDATNNNQAQKTQKWQLDYFVDTSETNVNLEKIKNLFGW